MTREQSRLVNTILEYQNEHGFPPTLAELADLTGVQSKSTVAKHLANLRAEGAVTWQAGKVRTLQVIV